jgi:hypothetical protein
MITSTNPFSQYYKTVSDSELLSILENTEDYQEAAVEAAREELQSRQLPPAQLESLKTQLLEKKEAAELARKKKEDVRQAIKDGSLSVLESLNPIHAELPSAEKILRYIIILWGIFTLISLITDYGLELDALKQFPFHPFLNSLILFPYIILPVSLFYLCKREPLGWTLFVIFLTFSFLSSLLNFGYALTWKPSGIKWMDDVFKPSLFRPIRQLLMVGGTFYAMCRLQMKELFLIEDKKMWITVGTTAALCFLCFLVLANQ